jgi:hypothetical protein
MYDCGEECYYVDESGTFYILCYNIGDKGSVNLKLSMSHAVI